VFSAPETPEIVLLVQSKSFGNNPARPFKEQLPMVPKETPEKALENTQKSSTAASE